MLEIDIGKLKNELLCYGVNCSLDVLDNIRKINPYASINKSVHSAFFLIDDIYVVNVPINERYTKSSPYTIELCSEQLLLYKNEQKIGPVTILPPPQWYMKETSNCTKMYDVLNVHNKNVLALTHYINCYYSNLGNQCLFCSVKGSNIPQLLDLEIRKRDIVETLVEALKENNQYTLALSEGVKNGDDRGAVYFSTILQEISANNIQIKSSVELAPPSNNSYIDLLYSSGASSIILNIEFYNDELRKSYCPGKSEISIGRYFDALSYSVKRFGYGNVASVLIVGIEPVDNTITCAKLLLDMCVLPIIIPFKPYDNCSLSNMKVTNPKDLDLVSENIRQYFRSKTFRNVCESACISCGACNVDYFIKREISSCLKGVD